MALDLEEILELIDMHGRTLVGECSCADCGAPVKQAMLGKLERMRELIEMLPLHVAKEEHEERTMQ